tara:strand:+ start:868 stop:1128 length:261 start_codon:yes stop_codon:yes gene_type:complete
VNKKTKKRIKTACLFARVWYNTGMINRIDQILANLNCAAVDGGFCLFVEDGEIVAKDLLSEEPLQFNIRFVGTDISDIEAKPLTKK